MQASPAAFGFFAGHLGAGPGFRPDGLKLADIRPMDPAAIVQTDARIPWTITSVSARLKAYAHIPPRQPPPIHSRNVVI